MNNINFEIERGEFICFLGPSVCPFGAPVKILGEGELSAAIKVEAHKFSQSAADKIRAAGGEVKELEVEG